MTHALSGTGSRHQPGTRFASADCAVWTVLYWVVPVPERGLTISPDGNTFTLEMQNVAVVDQPRWPALDSIATPARMTFKMLWKSTGEPVNTRTRADISASQGLARRANWRWQFRCLPSGFRGRPIR